MSRFIEPNVIFVSYSFEVSIKYTFPAPARLACYNTHLMIKYNNDSCSKEGVLEFISATDTEVFLRLLLVNNA
jgi:hypothetical protein